MKIHVFSAEVGSGKVADLEFFQASWANSCGCFVCGQQFDFGVHEASLKPESGVRLAEVFAELVVFDDSDASWKSCDHVA